MRRITGILHDNIRVYMIICGTIILRMRNFSDKIVEKIKTHILCSMTFFNNPTVNDIKSKIIVEPERPQNSKAHVHCMLDI